MMKEGISKKIKGIWLLVLLSAIILSGNLSLTGIRVSAAEGDSSPSFDGFYEVLDDPAAGSSGQDLDFTEKTIPDQKEDAPEQDMPELGAPEPDVPEQAAPELDTPQLDMADQAAPEQDMPELDTAEQDDSEQAAVETAVPEMAAPEQDIPLQEIPEPAAEEGPMAVEQTTAEAGAAAVETGNPLHEGHNDLILTNTTTVLPFTPQETDWYLFWTGDEYSLTIKDKDGAVLSPLILGEHPCYSLSEGVEYTVSLQTVMEMDTVYTSLGIVELLTIDPDIQAVAGHREVFNAYAAAGILYLTSSAPDVVEVVQNTSIELHPLKAGTAVISACIEGTNIRKDCRVTVVEPVVRKPQTFTLKAASSAIAAGYTTSLTVTGAKGKLSYQSSEPSIATVSKTGKINARKVGRTVITVTAAQTADYNAVSKRLTIKVLPAATASFKAAGQAKGIRLSWAKVEGATGYVIYRNNKKAKIIQSGSTLTWTDTAANTNGTKYTYRIVARALLGESPLSKTLAIWRLTPPAVTAVRNTASMKATVTYTGNTRATGYQIQYNTLKTFKTGNRAVNINSASTTYRTLSKLTKGKTWYVRVRACKTVNGVRYCSSWSPAKAVKILK